MSASVNCLPGVASPLVLSDRLIALAIDADRGGYTVAARHLVAIAHQVMEGPNRHRSATRSLPHIEQTSAAVDQF
jgi:hypothetical protein